MELSRYKINIAMARKGLTVTELAKVYGVSRSRMNMILNSRKVSTVCAGRLSAALGVDVTEIIDNE